MLLGQTSPMPRVKGIIHPKQRVMHVVQIHTLHKPTEQGSQGQIHLFNTPEAQGEKSQIPTHTSYTYSIEIRGLNTHTASTYTVQQHRVRRVRYTCFMQKHRIQECKIGTHHRVGKINMSMLKSTYQKSSCQLAIFAYYLYCRSAVYSIHRFSPYPNMHHYDIIGGVNNFA